MAKLYILFLAAISFIFFSFTRDGKKKAIPTFKTYLGCSDAGRGKMSDAQFLKLMKGKLCAKDTAGVSYPISSFELVYAETGLYQDSLGLPLKVTDYSLATFEGDSITAVWQRLFTESIFKGDTIKLTTVRVKGEDGKYYIGEEIDIIIQ
jgi:hypothetical protein